MEHLNRIRAIAVILVIGLFVTGLSNYYLSFHLGRVINEKETALAAIGNISADINYTKELLEIKKNELNSTKNKLNDTKNSLEENNSLLEELQSGNEYELHDPLYEEVITFINKDESSSTADEIDNAKMQGIRCAYTEVIINEEWVYELIAFDTVDKGFVYFEPLTDYEVYPEIGKNYTECVVNQPYILENDTITDILIIW